MQTPETILANLETLARVLRRVEQSTAVRALREDVLAAIMCERCTEGEAEELHARAAALRIVTTRTV